MAQNNNSVDTDKKRARIFINLFWQKQEIRDKVLDFAEKEGIIPSPAEVEAKMRAQMIGHTIEDDYEG